MDCKCFGLKCMVTFIRSPDFKWAATKNPMVLLLFATNEAIVYKRRSAALHEPSRRHRRPEITIAIKRNLWLAKWTKRKHTNGVTLDICTANDTYTVLHTHSLTDFIYRVISTHLDVCTIWILLLFSIPFLGQVKVLLCWYRNCVVKHCVSASAWVCVSASVLRFSSFSILMCAIIALVIPTAVQSHTASFKCIILKKSNYSFQINFNVTFVYTSFRPR